MCGVIDVCVCGSRHMLPIYTLPYSLPKFYQQKSSFLDAPENHSGPCLGVRFSCEDHLLFSHVGVENGVEFMPSSYNTLNNT